MCLLLRFSKFIAVPFFTEWLSSVEILSLDTALVNRSSRELFLLLMNEYIHLLHGNIFNPQSELYLLEVCRWCHKFSLPKELKCKVTNFDVNETINNFPETGLRVFQIAENFEIDINE